MRARLERKLAYAREKSAEIQDELDGLNEHDATIKDQMLIQSFVLEQFNRIKRFALSLEFFNIDNDTPGMIEPFTWIFAWSIVWGVYVFSCVWIVLWAAKVGSDQFAAWGKQFVVAFITDGFACAPLQIFVIRCLILMSIKSQLRKIYHVLNRVSTTQLQDGFVEYNPIVVARHMSAAIRVANNEVNADIPAARLLLRVSDYDDYECKSLREERIGLFVILVMLIPTIFAYMGEITTEVGIETWFPILWTGFSLANEQLYNYSILLFYLFYSLVFIAILYKIETFRNYTNKFTRDYGLNRFFFLSATPKGIDFRSSSRVEEKNSHELLGLWDHIRAKLKLFLNTVFKKDRLARQNISSRMDILWRNMNRHLMMQGRVLFPEYINRIIRKEISSHITNRFPPELHILKQTYLMKYWDHQENTFQRFMNEHIWGMKTRAEMLNCDETKIAGKNDSNLSMLIDLKISQKLSTLNDRSEPFDSTNYHFQHSMIPEAPFLNRGKHLNHVAHL
jgi:hypothetical protein